MAVAEAHAYNDEMMGSRDLAPADIAEMGDGPIVIQDREQLPPLHYAAYKGDLAGVLTCITDGHSVHDTINMSNQRSGVVCGITPLFLAAQRGRTKVVKLLVENGANPAQPAWVQGTTDLCMPAEVARLNFNFLVARYLDKAVDKRRLEDRVLQEDEAPPPAVARQASGRGVQAQQPAQPASSYMRNLGDLSGWDPASGAPPPEMGSKFVAKLLKKTKVDLLSWRPDTERTRDGQVVMATSSSRVVNPSDVEQMPGVEDHTRVISRYLEDLDLANWNPEDGPAPASAPGSRRASRGGQPPVPAAPTTSSLSADVTSVAAGAEPVPAQSARSTAAAAPAGPLPPSPLNPSLGVRQQSAGRNPNTAAAAAAAMAKRPPGKAPPPVKPASQRWFAHGSDSDEDEDVTPSKSVALSPEAAAQLAA
mmetsp:Transcript_305/g.767  ORF Transcript_305/g.767 Transcript_305/m.767 type:complete len:421 (-) Transcript_305:624-1886(-)